MYYRKNCGDRYYIDKFNGGTECTRDFYQRDARQCAPRRWFVSSITQYLNGTLRALNLPRVGLLCALKDVDARWRMLYEKCMANAAIARAAGPLKDFSIICVLFSGFSMRIFVNWGHCVL